MSYIWTCLPKPLAWEKLIYHLSMDSQMAWLLQIKQLTPLPGSIDPQNCAQCSQSSQVLGTHMHSSRSMTCIVSIIDYTQRLASLTISYVTTLPFVLKFSSPYHLYCVSSYVVANNYHEIRSFFPSEDHHWLHC